MKSEYIIFVALIQSTKEIAWLIKSGKVSLPRFFLGKYCCIVFRMLMFVFYIYLFMNEIFPLTFWSVLLLSICLVYSSLDPPPHSLFFPLSKGVIFSPLQFSGILSDFSRIIHKSGPELWQHCQRSQQSFANDFDN